LSPILNLNNATAAVVEARRAAHAADEALKVAQASFIEAAEAVGVEYVETDEGIRVAVEHRPRRSIDLSVLKDNLPLAVVAEVIKEAVDTKAFDAAVELGSIKDDVAEKAVTVKTSTQVRVYGDAVVGDRG
jgi:hypothetical protein